MSAEITVLSQVQSALGHRLVVASARGLSWFGEHGAGWLALGLAGAAVDRGRRRDWLVATAGVAGSHAVAVAVKRVVRRRRPDHESVAVLVGTPSRLSFPSAHAVSTAAAAVLFSGLTGRRLEPVLVPPMLVSRLVLGVHYPTDVVAGAALGAVLGGLVRRRLDGGAAG
ncbi:phosphatase PAP2 family protein [Saccharothrix texasensis]|uniref:5'-phosphoribosyl-monophospho-decaprenol phosphatase n=1 Tax=Saccharothrix texasensis TaxID=103734 RepID=A0A3N1H375_9PSEU|nr:phosphatase PAP2 family protein [Saccharothrix texasensis]ROP36876.1 5'-phosphoribosyl-monophospho-decaprenol phosphatase [Saccharothrix texasensis]